MKKLSVILLAMLLMMGMASASITRRTTYVSYSIRGVGGEVDYIGCDELLINPVIRYSGNAYVRNAEIYDGSKIRGDIYGNSHLTVQGRNEYGSIVRLNLNIRPSSIILWDGIRIHTRNSAVGTFWIMGSRPVRLTYDDLIIETHRVSGDTDIYAEGDLRFSISNIIKR